MNSLWDPVKLGNITLPHRFAMAPMTRSRAKPDGTPGDLAAEYYAQRASLGLIITEGTQPSDDGQGYTTTPGIYTDAHVAGWKKVTSAVHKAGGRIFFQIMHAGRMAHPDNTPHHRQPVAPSAVAPGQQMFTPTGMQDAPTPRALTTAEVKADGEGFPLLPPSEPLRRVLTAWKSTALTAIWCSSSLRQTPTRAAMNMVVRSKTGRALPLKWQQPLRLRLVRSGLASAFRPSIRQVAWSKAPRPAISIVTSSPNSNKLNLAYLHFLHDGR